MFVVPDNQVFELSDYVWSYFIEQSKVSSTLGIARILEK